MSQGVVERERTWPTYPICPCGCGAQGTKLQLKNDRHLVGCVCRPCIGRRNRSKGQRAQAKMHRGLGGEGFTPTTEESARPYQIEVTIMPESKTGGQVPTSFTKFITTDWFRRALEQSTRAVPVGSGARPAVVIDGNWVVVDIRGRR